MALQKKNSKDKLNLEINNLECTHDKTEYEYVPPDGGWGWLVLLGSVLVSLLIPGTIKSFGVLFVEFLEVFNLSPAVASWIPALTYFLYCSLGPLASYLSTKYGYRIVTLLGGVFAASGVIASVFATHIAHLYICYGILLGTGAGLCYPPGVFIVTSYFVRLRGLANGIAISGSALGSVILPPFLRFLLETYGYRGAVLILGGLILNVLVGASLYDPVQQHLKKVPVVKSEKDSKHHNADENTDKKANGEVVKLPEEKALLDTVIFEAQEIPTKEDEVILAYHPSTPKKDLHMSAVSQPLIILEGDSNMRNGGSHLSLNRQTANSGSAQHISRKISTGSYRGRNSYLMGSTGQITRRMSVSRPLPRVASATTMSRKISVGSMSSFRYISTPFHGSTLVGLNPEFSSQITMKTAEKTSCFSSVCPCFCKSRGEETEEKKGNQADIYWSLLRDPVFIIILISNATTAIGYTNFTILLPAYAISLGFDKDKASYLLSIVSTLDLVGRVGGSALSDWLPIDKKYYYVGGLLFSGISLVLLPLAYSYNSLAVFCAAYGLSSGVYVGITAIFMVDLLGEDRLVSSYGISLFVNGILQLLGPPICGAAFQYINSYGPIVEALGVTLIAGAAVWVYLPFIKHKENDQVLA
ncbi:monocarboxylate transporter 13 isoform X1 [Homalodisca vitripennis]|uniref:monocarboxylate transporter 13 isoform X1 n=1 Tax=Homalodisca vitripennis TaxID=197043 RepID=UPI001EEBD028|nr:monocarboxylate transporter 13 isoform X1 [Homalodisca vitripennis]